MEAELRGKTSHGSAVEAVHGWCHSAPLKDDIRKPTRTITRPNRSLIGENT
jgi:hypothetical protein